MRRVVFVGVVVTVVAASVMASGCGPECSSNADCDVDDVCIDDACIPEDAAVGEGEGEGEEGEGEGEGETELVATVVFLDGASQVPATGLVYTGAKSLIVEARDSGGVAVSNATCSRSRVVIDAPTATTDDAEETVRCSTVSIDDGAGIPGVVQLLPLAVSVNATPVTVAAAALAQPGTAATLVTTTDTTSCTFLEPPPRLGGPSTVRCGRGGLTVDAGVVLEVTANVTSVVLGLSGQTLVASVQQVSASSCDVTCGAATVTTLVEFDGTIDAVFPTAPNGSSACTVTCKGSDDAATPTTSFDVFAGSLTASNTLTSAASADALIGSIALTTEDLAVSINQVVTAAFNVVTGDVEIRDGGDGGNTLRISFPDLREVGGALTVRDAFDLASLVDTDGISSNDSTDASFPVLTGIGKELTITGNTSMTTMTLPAVQSIGTSLTITGNTSMTTMTLNSGYSLGGNPAGRDFTIEFNGPDLSCAEIDVALDAVSVCPAAGEIAAADHLGASCALTCN